MGREVETARLTGLASGWMSESGAAGVGGEGATPGMGAFFGRRSTAGDWFHI